MEGTRGGGLVSELVGRGGGRTASGRWSIPRPLPHSHPLTYSPVHTHSGAVVARSTLQLFDSPPPLTVTFTVLVPLKVITVRAWLTDTGPMEPLTSTVIVPELGQTCELPASLAGRTRF